MNKESEKRLGKHLSKAAEGGTGQNPGDNLMSDSNNTPADEPTVPEFSTMIERVVERPNMIAAYKRVVSNKGASGIDGMSVDELQPYLDKHWPTIKGQLLKGQYQPQGVRKVSIPKPGGGQRLLGIPTVRDRLIQQALYQVLGPIFQPHFSANSYGFIPKRNAHQAVEKARAYQSQGRRWVVDMDIEKFFDHVNHDVLITLIRRRMNERLTLKLIRSYLRSGIMEDGIAVNRTEGTPQGSPLSPLLSNIILDELDKELEQRGHDFVRYADDCNIYVGSRKAGERVKGSISQWIESNLKLKLNETKTQVTRPWQSTFLGYSFTWHKRPLIRVPKESVQRFKRKVKSLFRMGRGRNLQRFIRDTLNPVIRGWINYFKLSETKGFAEDLDSWLRRRLRAIKWRQWKRPWTRFRNLMKAGLAEKHAATCAFNGRGSWFNAGSSHMNLCFRKKYFDTLGLVSILETLLKTLKSLTNGTALYGTVRRVV